MECVCNFRINCFASSRNDVPLSKGAQYADRAGRACASQCFNAEKLQALKTRSIWFGCAARQAPLSRPQANRKELNACLPTWFAAPIPILAATPRRPIRRTEGDTRLRGEA